MTARSCQRPITQQLRPWLRAELLDWRFISHRGDRPPDQCMPGPAQHAQEDQPAGGGVHRLLHPVTMRSCWARCWAGPMRSAPISPALDTRIEAEAASFAAAAGAGATRAAADLHRRAGRRRPAAPARQARTRQSPRLRHGDASPQPPGGQAVMAGAQVLTPSRNGGHHAPSHSLPTATDRRGRHSPAPRCWHQRPRSPPHPPPRRPRPRPARHAARHPGSWCG